MNILSVSYQNIGPFENKLITLNFKDGKYLIKAPIGSGKSFLFFDGPVFGIYKYSVRSILNRKCNEGFVKIFFESNGDYFLISRVIKSTKTGGETINSSLYKVDVNSPEILSSLGGIINYDIDIQQILNGYLEEIPFKSQIELQNTVQDLLPLREVFLSTNFLMQDSDNIFELTASERIDIFKNIFGLLSIDEAKDIVAENKKEIQLSLKIKSDQSGYNQKLKDCVSNIQKIRSELLSNVINPNGIQKNLFETIHHFFEDGFFSDMDLIGENVNIGGFELPSTYSVFMSETFSKIDTIRTNYQNLFSSYEILKRNFEEEKQKVSSYELQKHDILKKIAQIEDLIRSFDITVIDSNKHQKQELIAAQKSIIDSLDFDKLNSLGYKPKDIFELNSLIDELTNNGKTLKAQYSEVESKIENLEKEKQRLELDLKNLELVAGTPAYDDFQKELSQLKKNFESDLKNFELEKKHLVDRKQQYTFQLNDLQQKIDSISQEYDNNLTFYCEKISTSCPFVDKIKGESLQTIFRQKKLLEDNYQKVKETIDAEKLDEKQLSIDNKISKILETISDLEVNPNNYLKDFTEKLNTKKELVIKLIQESNFESLIKQYSQQKTEYSIELEKVKVFFNSFDWKLAKQQFDNYKDIDQKIRELDRKITELEEKQKSIDDYNKQIISYKASVEMIDSQIIQIQNKIHSIDEELSRNISVMKDYNIELISKISLKLEELRSNLDFINNLVSDFKKDQLSLKKLQEEEKVVNELYNIFSKELMLVVLQDFLPSLSEVINSLLAQVVDYQLRFELIKKSSDKLELDIQINDKRGLRPVKSLSGGQKTILKLAWMLAIGSMMRVKFLFLDETINNLDEDAVGRVSGLLEDFLKTNNMKFYVVTHSQQIQSLDIWDQIIEIS